MTAKRSGKAYYMISAVAQKYNIHPQTLRLYEREGLLKPSRSDGNPICSSPPWRGTAWSGTPTRAAGLLTILASPSIFPADFQ